jgi:iron complex outermembrane receptor protein
MNKAETPVAIEHNIESERGTPRYYGSLRSQWNISANRQFDAWLRGSAGYELPHAPYGGLIKVPGYVTLDLRYAHRLSKSLEVSISGRNLIGGRRNEFIAEYVPSVPVSIGSSLLVGLRWGF